MRKPKISADEFAERVNKAYDGRISIVKETYTGTRHQVTAYCNVHKIYFQVNLAQHLYEKKCNCPECSKEKQIKSARLKYVPFSQMLERFRKLYGDKFSYDASTYCGLKKKMKVHCNDCGEDFEITPEHHLKYNNGGCPKCHLTRIVKCMKCGKEIVVDRHVSLNIKMLCDECKDDIKKSNIMNKEIRKRKTKNNKNYLKRCPFCGQLHNTNEQCENELCNKFQSIKDLKKLIPFGFDYSTIGTIRYIDEFNKAIDLLLYEYFNNKLSPRQIYEKYNCKEYFNSEGTLRYFLKQKLNQDTRNLSEAQKNSIEMGVHNFTIHNYVDMHKIIKHLAWDDKFVYLRSSYEENYAQLLDQNKILYEVEVLRIFYFDTQQKQKRIAIPDFYLPETNTIVEIKSDWTLDVINMLDKVKAYKELGYNFKLILEHKEVDINSLINKPLYKAQGKNHIYQNCAKTIIKSERWHWMNDSINNYKVPESKIKEYEEKGFVFGCLMNIRNRPKSISFIKEMQKQSQDSNSPTSPPKSNPLF